MSLAGDLVTKLDGPRHQRHTQVVGREGVNADGNPGSTPTA
jgi:hypothetical protein